MDSPQNQNHTPASESFGTVPNRAASFGKVPQDAETFGSVRNSAEGFRTVPQPAESRDKYTLNVREVSRMFEAAGVARSERSIVNWCQRNALGVGKLDAYFDPNERKYFITPESVEMAIAEEKAKAARHGAGGEPIGNIPKPAEAPQPATPTETPADTNRVKALESEVMDLKITNRAKDYFIDQLKQNQKEFVVELATVHRRVGELETQLLQLEAPEQSKSRRLDVQRDTDGASELTT